MTNSSIILIYFFLGALFLFLDELTHRVEHVRGLQIPSRTRSLLVLNIFMYVIGWPIAVVASVAGWVGRKWPKVAIAWKNARDWFFEEKIV